MPVIYFGRNPLSKGPTPLSIETPNGKLEPCAPSDFKIYCFPVIATYIHTLVVRFIGHIIAVLSYPQNSYIPLSHEGERFKAPESQISFPKPGFGFAMLKGEIFPEMCAEHLEVIGFRSTVFSKVMVWLKEEAKREDFIWVRENIKGINDTSFLPDRYLNPSSFQSYLALMALTTRICEAFHRLAVSGKEAEDDDVLENSKIKGWRDITDRTAHSADLKDVDASDEPEFTNKKAFKTNLSVEKSASALLMVHCSNGIPSFASSGAAVNPYASPLVGFINTGDTIGDDCPGKIFKYHPGLALPDPNLIGDVIGRRFLTCLGPTRTDQFTNLQTLKSGLSGLRLLPIGSILNHLYKCFDIALECQSGCIAFFTGPVYEGCVLRGGPCAHISIGDQIVDFEDPEDLQKEFSDASIHSQSLRLISDFFESSGYDGEVRSCASMVELRIHCLALKCTPDERDKITQLASHLEFGPQPWVISPAKLQSAFLLMANPLILKNTDPISRLCLFSNDPVRLGLSCFGEKSCPSWDIPNGSRVSLLTANPPTVPAQVQMGKGSKGDISDAPWVMPIRVTDLFSAEEEFRRMAGTCSYRSISSVLAKRQRMRVFSRDRMAVFWKEMQLAVGRINPSAKFGEELASSGGKKRALDIGEGPSGGSVKRRVELDF